MTTEVQGVSEEPLTAADRCDRCGAQARVKTAHLSGDLLWCAHHATEHAEALTGHVVVDERKALT